MTEREISRILKNAIPRPPDLSGLGKRVRNGHRRRRITQAAVAVLALAAVAVPVALQINSQREEPPLFATPSPTPTAEETSTPPTQTPTPQPTLPGAEDALTTDHVNSQVCEDAQGTISEFPDSLIPDDVTRVYLCSNDQEPDIPIFGAPEPIILDVSDIIAAVNASPEATPGTCEPDGDGVFGYVAVLEYADGERLVVNTSNVDCLPVATDGTGAGRGDSKVFFDSLRERLLEQRSTMGGRYEGDENLCLEARSIITTSIHDMARGWACGVEPSSEVAYEGIIRNPLPDALVARIVDEATSNATPSEAHGLPLFSQTILLQNLHGDPYTIYRWPNGTFQLRDGIRWLDWTPSDSLVEELATYFEGTRPDVFPEPAQPEVCMDPNLLEYQGALSDAFTAELCLAVLPEGTYETRAMPVEVFDGFIAELEAAATTVPRDTDFSFDGHWIAALNSRGQVRQLFITSDGDFVWDDQEDFDVRYTATPPQRVTDWLRSSGVEI